MQRNQEDMEEKGIIGTDRKPLMSFHLGCSE